MGPKKTAHRNPVSVSQQPPPVVLSASLRTTDTEKHATSKSLYGDHKARVSSNVQNIHDRIRLSAYKSILGTLSGKRVLHLGCGMGLISMLVARGNAKQVVAVDSSAIVDCSNVVAQQNKLANIQFLRGKIQEVIPVPSSESEKFDIVLCEWNGAFLTNDSILDDLLYCRDYLLAHGGLICPDRSSMHVVGISDFKYYDESVNFWDDVYGFQMRSMKKMVLQEASTCHIPSSCILTTAGLVHTVDIHTLSADKKAFSSTFVIKVSKKGTVHYLTFFVDATFTNPQDTGANFALGFNPGGSSTWTEVSVPLSEAIPVNAMDVLQGTVKVSPRTRLTEIEVSVTCVNGIGSFNSSGKYVYLY